MVHGNSNIKTSNYISGTMIIHVTGSFTLWTNSTNHNYSKN